MTEADLTCALSTVVSGYLVGAPELDVLVNALGELLIYALTAAIRKDELFPDEVTEILDCVCGQLRAATGFMLRRADAGTDV
jgi:hypothetical protein